MFRAFLLVVLLISPLALAQGSDEPRIDATITLSPSFGPVIDAPSGLVTIQDELPGQRYMFDLTLTKAYTTLEIRANGFDIARPKQIFPSLALPETEYPLFEPFPNEMIWDVDSPATVYHTNGTKDAVVLRLGLAGPRNVTLVIARDVTPPTFVMGPVQSVTQYSFYQEVNTSEIAIGDIQVRKMGAQEWVVNPTPVFHFRMRFPVQGLMADTEYEARFIATDWAGNQAESEIYTVRSAPAPVGPPVTITPVSPLPNATVPAGKVLIRANVSSPGASIPGDGIRVFFDKTEVTQSVDVADGVVSYTPTKALAPGVHAVSVEAINDEGGTGLAKWTFTVEGPDKGTPLPVGVALIALAVAVFLARRR